MSRIACTLCTATSHLVLNVKEYIRRVKLFHAHRPDFRITCGIEGCQRVYRNPGTFFNHVYDVHGSNSQPTETLPGDHDQTRWKGTSTCTDEPTDCNDQSCTPSEDVLKKNSALFLLGLKGHQYIEITGTVSSYSTSCLHFSCYNNVHRSAVF